MLVDNRGKGTSPAAFYSDVNTYKVCTYEGADVATVPACITSNPRKLAAVSSIFSLESPFMAAVLQVRLFLPKQYMFWTRVFLYSRLFALLLKGWSIAV